MRPDVVFMDPPRAGSDRKFLTSLLKTEPKRIVYVSCIRALLSGKKACDAHGGDSLSAAGLTDKTENLTVSDAEADAAHGIPIPVMEPYVQISYFQHR